MNALTKEIIIKCFVIPLSRLLEEDLTWSPSYLNSPNKRYADVWEDISIKIPPENINGTTDECIESFKKDSLRLYNKIMKHKYDSYKNEVNLKFHTDIYFKNLHCYLNTEIKNVPFSVKYKFTQLKNGALKLQAGVCIRKIPLDAKESEF